jgi:hypothetical protein
MSKHLRTLFLTAALCLGGTFFHSPANAQCNQRSLNGAYGYSVSGTIVAGTGMNAPPPLFTPGPFAAVGRIQFDGKGGVSTVRTLSESNVVVENDFGTGTYSVNKDCTGSFNITVGPVGNTVQLNLNFVLDDTNEIRAIVTNPNIILLLNARKQYPILYF